MALFDLPDDVSSSDDPKYKCDLCQKEFSSKRSFAGHNVGKHKIMSCHICGTIIEDRAKLGIHKIEVHGFRRQQLGWRLVGGWNKGKTQLEAFNVTGTVHHGNAEFMNRLNTPEYLKVKKLSRKYHEEVVLRKEDELKAQGYRTFCTSNYAHHNRIPDIIAISPQRKVVAVEMESVKLYKSSQDSIRKRYTNLLMGEDFF